MKCAVAEANKPNKNAEVVKRMIVVLCVRDEEDYREEVGNVSEELCVIQPRLYIVGRPQERRLDCA